MESAGGALLLVMLAELGDKSQLVCMALAARHRPSPVFWGAALAFSVLNLLAVGLGAGASDLIPVAWILGAASALFLLMAGLTWHTAATLSAQGPDSAEIPTFKARRGIFWGTFVLITLAEMGDKTQIAVAGLAATESPVGVWAGATLGLGLTTAMAVWLGRTQLSRLPRARVARTSALLFLAFGVWAGLRAARLA